MKKLIFLIVLFFPFFQVTFAESVPFVLSGSTIFPDFDYSNFGKSEIRSLSYESGSYDTINYSFLLKDISISLYEIKIILIYLAIGGTAVSFYHLLNDWIGKK